MHSAVRLTNFISAVYILFTSLCFNIQKTDDLN